MQYELLYIIPTSFTDEDVARIEGNVKGILEKYGATVDTTTRLGKFRFAYAIKNQRHGHYILVNFTSETKNLSKIDEGLRISTEVLRHMILRADEAGGDKFDLVQFVEVNTDAKDDRPRRKREDGDAKKATEDKSGVAALETKTESAPTTEAISDEELDKKLEATIPNV